MNPILASIGSSDAISIISTTFGCTLKGYFANGLIHSFRWLRVIGCKAVISWVVLPVLLLLVVGG